MSGVNGGIQIAQRRVVSVRKFKEDITEFLEALMLKEVAAISLRREKSIAIIDFHARV